MDKENFTHTHAHHEILFSLNKERSPAVYRFMDEPEGHYAKWNKPDRYRQELYDITYALRKKKKEDRIEWASLVAQLTKNPPAMQETWV